MSELSFEQLCALFNYAPKRRPLEPKEAAEILSYIATEASQRSGGNKYEIAAKRSRILVMLKSGLSTSLAVQMAQRIFGHVRGSAVHGQQPHPISALLSLSKE